MRSVNWALAVITKSHNEKSVNPWTVSTTLPQAEGNFSGSEDACTARDAYSASKEDSQNAKEAVAQLTLCKSLLKLPTLELK